MAARVDPPSTPWAMRLISGLDTADQRAEGVAKGLTPGALRTIRSAVQELGLISVMCRHGDRWGLVN